MIENGKILEIKVGSHLYGVNTETSDTDFCGVFIPPVDYILGLKSITNLDVSTASKLKNGKNDLNAIDRKFYEIRSFVNLALAGNPNIIEMLFANDENIVFCNELGRALLNNRRLFLSKRIIPKFIGFARSQRNKLVVKTKNIDVLSEAITFLKKEDGKITLPELKLQSGFEDIFVETKDVKNYVVGAYKINRNITVKSALKTLVEFYNLSTHRKSIIDDFGYELKYASHYLRLLLQTIEMCKTGDLVFPLKEKQLILDVKMGKVSYDKFLEISDHYHNLLKECEIENTLKEEPDTEAIENIIIGGMKKWIEKEI